MWIADNVLFHSEVYYTVLIQLGLLHTLGSHQHDCATFIFSGHKSSYNASKDGVVQMDNAIERNINLFFQDPRIEPVIPGKLSVLYLLRRDVMHCFDHNIILFPATMTILAGIDLLAKFYAGNDKTGQVGARFKNLIKRYFSNISNDDAIV